MGNAIHLSIQPLAFTLKCGCARFSHASLLAESAPRLQKQALKRAYATTNWDVNLEKVNLPVADLNRLVRLLAARCLQHRVAAQGTQILIGIRVWLRVQHRKSTWSHVKANLRRMGKRA
jgi:hypothetical protein